MQTQNAHLAIASVPVQSWGELYDQDAALKTGTIFKDLDLPFFPVRNPVISVLLFRGSRRCGQ